MNIKTILRSILAALVFFIATRSLQAQGTAFTYQGLLGDGGGPATGLYDFRFKLYFDQQGNSQAGQSYLVSAVGVTNGLFATTIDFGAGIFAGSNFWLEIDVKTNASDAYTDLAPLQAITPTPYSIYAESAASAQTAAVAATATTAGAVGSNAVTTAAIQSNAVTSGKIASGQVVKSLAVGGGALYDNITLAAGNNVSITPSGQTLTIAASGSGSGWTLLGNSGTLPGLNFIGTTDNQPLEFWVNNSRALRLEPGGSSLFASEVYGFSDATGAPNLIGGSPLNYVANGVVGATIAGGGATNYIHTASFNSVTADLGTVSGGTENVAGGLQSTVGGGWGNLAMSHAATVGGGSGNHANSEYTTVAGGSANASYGSGAAVSGGILNIAKGTNAAVGGGGQNYASGLAAFIGGGENNQATNSYTTVSGGYNNAANSIGDTVGGGSFNTADSQFGGATVGGGGDNSATGINSTIGGGNQNSATGEESTVGGGGGNAAFTQRSTISGGYQNGAFGDGVLATISGGYNNFVTGAYSAISGGASNRATNYCSTVTGGQNNLAGGAYSFAAGNGAQAIYDGSFVWSDGTGDTTQSVEANSVTMHASGGFFFSTSPGTGAVLPAGQTTWFSLSDRNAKKNFQPVDAREVLDKLAAIRVQRWNYKWEKDTDTPNIGPMAQDFVAAFYPGRDDKRISTLEFDGVELAAIQGLNIKLNQKGEEVKILRRENELLAEHLKKLEAMVRSLIDEK